MINFTQIKRKDWARLPDYKNYISSDELKSIVVLGDVINVNDVNEVYLPLIKYLHLFIQNKKMLDQIQVNFIGQPRKKSPFIIGISGSVAVGKSTTARLLQILLKRCYPDLQIQMITTDSFLYPNTELKKRRLMNRKGFPESYNMKLLVDFLSDVTSGKEQVYYPMYSQEISDIIPDQFGSVTRPDIFIIEGINTLQLPPIGCVATSDFFDFSIYIDANEKIIETWFIQRFKYLLKANKRNPGSFYYQWANGPLKDAIKMAERVWQMVNLINLREYIGPTKNRANIILHKTDNHSIDSLFIRNY